MKRRSALGVSRRRPARAGLALSSGACGDTRRPATTALGSARRRLAADSPVRRPGGRGQGAQPPPRESTFLLRSSGTSLPSFQPQPPNVGFERPQLLLCDLAAEGRHPNRLAIEEEASQGVWLEPLRTPIKNPLAQLALFHDELREIAAVPRRDVALEAPWIAARATSTGERRRRSARRIISSSPGRPAYPASRHGRGRSIRSK